jgi:hypothetical protein
MKFVKAKIHFSELHHLHLKFGLNSFKVNGKCHWKKFILDTVAYILKTRVKFLLKKHDFFHAFPSIEVFFFAVGIRNYVVLFHRGYSPTIAASFERVCFFFKHFIGVNFQLKYWMKNAELHTLITKLGERFRCWFPEIRVIQFLTQSYIPSSIRPWLYQQTFEN